MISYDIEVDLGGLDLAGFAASLQDRGILHARLAGDAEIFLREVAPSIVGRNHRTADRLGARRTGHLEDAFQAIEGVSSEQDARLLIPRASRLRAAFGSYVVKPVNGGKAITIPVHPDAYGRRAREFADLFLMNTGPGKTPVLARRVEGKKDQSLRAAPRARRRARRFTTAEILYLLVDQVEIPEDRNLIPFDELAEEAVDSANAWIDDQVERSLGS